MGVESGSTQNRLFTFAGGATDNDDDERCTLRTTMADKRNGMDLQTMEADSDYSEWNRLMVHSPVNSIWPFFVGALL